MQMKEEGMPIKRILFGLVGVLLLVLGGALVTHSLSSWVPISRIAPDDFHSMWYWSSNWNRPDQAIELLIGSIVAWLGAITFLRTFDQPGDKPTSLLLLIVSSVLCLTGAYMVFYGVYGWMALNGISTSGDGLSGLLFFPWLGELLLSALAICIAAGYIFASFLRLRVAQSEAASNPSLARSQTGICQEDP